MSGPVSAGTRGLWRVTAGALPDVVDPQFTRQWTISTAEWASKYRHDVMAERMQDAMAYAASLQDPGRLTWVRLEWIWL